MTHRGQLVGLALALSTGAALSLGITRFSYGLLFPPMRADLGWSYTLVGAINTANGLGYLMGALIAPRLLRRYGASRLLLMGAIAASVLMGLGGFLTGTGPWLMQRLLAGTASALVFIAGGLLAVRLAALQPAQAGFLMGLYYGGTGFGIVLSALLVPAVLAVAEQSPRGWAWAWWALTPACFAATATLVWPARALQYLTPQPPASVTQAVAFRWQPLSYALAGYAMFGVGYIGYMTFVIALLREQGFSGQAVTLFYALLGIAVLASTRIWAGMLDRCKGGQLLAILSALLGLATLMPALTSVGPVILASGMLFGGVFLSLVASTTALVQHNLPRPHWGAGISAFTIVFAVGQIVGPTIVGWIADGPGGLARGLLFSAVVLWVAAALAWRQRALALPELSAAHPSPG